MIACYLAQHMQDHIFNKLGQLAAMALLHGGAGFHILSQSLYNYVSGMSMSDIIISSDEVPNPVAKEAIQEVSQLLVLHV